MKNYDNYRLDRIDEKIRRIGFYPLDILVVGSTGSGKSSTLNALFTKDVAKVGESVSPETMDVQSYRLNELLRFWDTPGLGDDVHKDVQHCKLITKKITDTFDYRGEPYGLIDMVIVVIEGSTRDMGSTYKLLNEVIIPSIDKSRILVAINQADVAKKGHDWNYNTNKPNDLLISFLEEKAVSIRNRVFEATGVNIIKPVYYSAVHNYNIDKFLDLIIDNMPLNRRKMCK